MKQYGFSSRYRQQGAALMIGLVVLVIMTLLGVTAMRNTTLQERMSGALHDQNLAFQAAESALRAGERALSQSPTIDFSQAGWYHSSDTDERPDWEQHGNDPSQLGDGVVDHHIDDIDRAFPPQYYVEHIPVVMADSDLGGSMALGDGTVNTEHDMYRIVARGFGNNPRTVVVLESTFRR